MPHRPKDAAGRRATVLQRLHETLERNDGMPVRLTELCRDVGAPARTLRHYCRNSLGVGPIRYLHLQRLQLARASLLEANPGTTTVTDVATRFGFLELGRFAAMYRAQFGELPSATLRHGGSAKK
jgi:transcriptional regulator GlxA family with amidase domain